MSDNPDAQLSIEGVTDVTDMLERIAADLEDMAPFAEAARELFYKVEQERFNQEGPGWAQLAPSTLENKARYGQRSSILQATGALMESLTHADASGAVFIPIMGGDDASVTLGTNLQPSRPGRGWEGTALAWFHQHGTSKMPARPVIDPTGADLIPAATTWLTNWLTGLPTDTVVEDA